MPAVTRAPSAIAAAAAAAAAAAVPGTSGAMGGGGGGGGGAAGGAAAGGVGGGLPMEPDTPHNSKHMVLPDTPRARQHTSMLLELLSAGRRVEEEKSKETTLEEFASSLLMDLDGPELEIDMNEIAQFFRTPRGSAPPSVFAADGSAGDGGGGAAAAAAPVAALGMPLLSDSIAPLDLSGLEPPAKKTRLADGSAAPAAAAPASGGSAGGGRRAPSPPPLLHLPERVIRRKRRRAAAAAAKRAASEAGGSGEGASAAAAAAATAAAVADAAGMPRYKRNAPAVDMAVVTESPAPPPGLATSLFKEPLGVGVEDDDFKVPVPCTPSSARMAFEYWNSPPSSGESSAARTSPRLTGGGGKSAVV
eukprot:PLAT2253.1.p1 GENE.PLAT2253.1~~PLAT2253.1.p1  ORF type:complete len:415 (-),score=155.70 PLAT2253.1:65-1150(-)